MKNSICKTILIFTALIFSTTLSSCDSKSTEYNPVLIEYFDEEDFTSFIEENESNGNMFPMVYSHDSKKMVIGSFDLDRGSWTTPTPYLYIYDMVENVAEEIFSDYDRSIQRAVLIEENIYYIDTIFMNTDDNFPINWRVISYNIVTKDMTILYSSWIDSPFDVPVLYKDGNTLSIIGLERNGENAASIIAKVSQENEFEVVIKGEIILDDNAYSLYYPVTSDHVDGMIYFLAFDEESSSSVLRMNDQSNKLEVFHKADDGVNILDVIVNGDSILLYCYDKNEDVYMLKLLVNGDCTFEYKRYERFAAISPFRDGFIMHNSLKEWAYLGNDSSEIIFLEEDERTETPHYVVLDDHRIIVKVSDSRYIIKKVDLESKSIFQNY